MNERNYRKYSQEFKLEALELLRRADRGEIGLNDVDAQKKASQVC